MRPPASWAGLRHRRTLWACVCASGVASAPLEIVIGTTRPCAAMGNSRKQWIFIDFHWFSLISIGFHWFSWISIDFHGYLIVLHAMVVEQASPTATECRVSSAWWSNGDPIMPLMPDDPSRSPGDAHGRPCSRQIEDIPILHESHKVYSHHLKT